MALTDEQLQQTAGDAYRALAAKLPHEDCLLASLRAVEAAATAPLLERIAALTAQVEQAAQPVYEMYRGEVCYRSDDDDQSFGMLCPAHDIPDGTKLYTSPPKAAPLTDEKIHEVWASENGLEDCVMCKLTDFTTVVRFVEQLHGITPATVEKGGE